MNWLGKLIWRHAFVIDGELFHVHFDGHDWNWHLREDVVAWAKETHVRLRIDWMEGSHPNGRHGHAIWPRVRFYRAKDAVLFKLRWL